MEVELMGISMSLTWLLSMITLGFSVLYVAYECWSRTYWWRRGVPYEPSLPIIGNPLFTSKIPENFVEWNKKYGKVYGTYSFRDPVLVVGDPEMLRHLLVKSFNSFHNRVSFPQIPEELAGMVSLLEGERWKEVRNVLTPSFSGAKMKQMSHLVNNSADSLVKHIGIMQKEKGHTEFQNLFGSFVMDTVGSCAFGIDIDSQSDPKSPFVTNAKKAFQFDLTNPLFILGTLIPILGKVLTYFRIAMFIPADTLDFFRDVNKKTIALRKSSSSGPNSKRVDFLQLLLDAQKQENIDKESKPEEEEEDDDDIHADLDKHHDVQYHSRGLGKKATLTDNEVFAQGLIFFTAGSETTTTLLGFIAYSLATNPEAQEKLIDEIDRVTPSRDSVGYKSVATMPYLDQVVCETLRIFPPAAVSNRMCNETFVHNGLMIEKGTQVFIPVYTIHRDPDYWPEPEKFVPERFTKEAKAKQHPLAWQPFGAGPRNCIGMRFALMETKMAVVRVFQNYRLETNAQTEIPPKFNRTGFLTPPNGITLTAVPRTDKVAY
ncbi:cytochrome P450 3A30 [Strongylocentrotus purpuratus]|uniref:Thromboxane-A synthase n=1 Tax=Strongylocentrotus purpuratus TaxID=7668 RepID=A0A7M7SVF3_STRPU|nr:cytochrome P450 3A30 [Strongylocentrotus purpuratus]